MEGTAWDADVDDAKMARIGNASLRKKEWRQAHAAKAAVAANDIWDDDDIDEETATVIAGAEERRRLSTRCLSGRRRSWMQRDAVLLRPVFVVCY